MPLINIPKDARKDKPPCGECHLQPGETCDICGAHQHALATEQDAIDAMFAAHERLKALGWRDGIYMPKDGTPVIVIENGSTGQFECRYHGEWPNGFFNVFDGADVYPSRSVPPLFKPKPKP